MTKILKLVSSGPDTCFASQKLIPVGIASVG